MRLGRRLARLLGASALLPLLATAAISEPVFVDRSAALPVAHVYAGGWEHFVGGGIAAFDCNGDGRLDLVAAGGTNPAHLFINTTARPSAALTFELGTLPLPAGTTGAYPLDVDGDGILDLAVLRVGANKLLRGLGDCRFEDATQRWRFAGGDRWSVAFAATWEPGRTLATLAVGNYVDRTDPAGPFEACDANELHRALDGGYGPPRLLEPGFCTLSMLFSDWARRGTPDLRVSNDRHYYVRGGSEQMWRLDPLRLLGPDDGFDPISIWGMGIASEDLDGDGRAEVVLTSMGDQLLLFATAPVGYRPAPYALGTYAHRPHTGEDGRPSTGWHAEFGDVDNDGLSDLFIAKGNVDHMPSNAMADPNNLLMQQPDGIFVERSVEAGVASPARSRGAVLADLDNDGRLDLVVVNRRAPMELYQNTTTPSGRWLAVTLRQPPPNTFAIGAWLELRGPASEVRSREITVGGGHGGGDAGPIHWGLGTARTAEVRARWPDGTVSPWLELGADEHVELWRTADDGLAQR